MIDFWEIIRKISPHAEPILIISLTAILGLLLGSIRVAGIKLGVAGMLFSGLLLGHFGLTLEPELMSFLKEFGLALFVFTVGLQLGPGFFNSLKKDGLRLNALAALIVLSGALIVFGGGKLLGWSEGVLSGLFSGSTTNTPSLGAAQQLMQTIPADAKQVGLSSMAYAVAYPFGVVGIILAMLILRVIFRIDPKEELEALKQELAKNTGTVDRITIMVDNPHVTNVPLREIPGIRGDGPIISRLRRQGSTEVVTVTSSSTLEPGDLILAVGSPEQLHRAQIALGKIVDEDLVSAPGKVVSKRVLVTHKAMIGTTVAGTRLSEKYGVTISRVSRQGMVLTATAGVKLQFGDMVNLVGEEEQVALATKALGNSVRELNETSFASIFVGLTVGVLVGLFPWSLPGVPVPLRLGLAGGPLIVAILMGRMGRVGPLVFHMPMNANIAFRELGIILFLACVGLSAGKKFAATAFTTTGLHWMALGAAVTMVPLLIAGVIGRRVFKLNYLTLSGVLAGSMTDPPALAFANKMTHSDYPALAYANVYPLTMLLRILVVQLAILWAV